MLTLTPKILRIPFGHVKIVRIVLFQSFQEAQ